MASPTNDYPPLTNWQDLERLAVDLFTAIKKQQFQRWGREGQPQDGIDAWSIMPSGKAVVVQCKGKSQRFGKKLTVNDVNSALKSVGDFKFDIEEIYLLTTAPDDVKVLHHAADLSAKRLARGECAIRVWGWGTICDRINLYEEVQRAHFGHWFKKVAIHQWIGLAVVVSIVVTASVVLGLRVISDQRVARLQHQDSVKDLQRFVELADDLEDAHGKCLGLLESQLFSFQEEFRRNCTEPVAARLKGIEQQVQKVAPSLAAEAWTEIYQISHLMTEDYRQAAIAAQMTQSFEEEVIRGLRDLCIKPLPTEMREARQESTLRAEQLAITSQLHYYFVLRDFIIPGLSIMRSRVLVRSRELTAQPVPAALAAQANQLTTLLHERKEYVFNEPEEPFKLSAVKAMSARDIRFSSSEPNDIVEEAHRLRVVSVAPAKVFYGKPKDIEALISCGVFNPAARKLATRL
ncbi:hypothetical protein ACI2UK_24400 [Ralstonia nicotianae]|uniref:hypothetical protein n=1 Tax=Ralstonia pseudosolanacearum TaxID=1310165 RepID=UPI0020034D1E|nr:hypothetical protein [Ralstonia pseudosolanacearum]MCK4120416.1 hypothetical protein [Ralstonia pseudosolanacearum]